MIPRAFLAALRLLRFLAFFALFTALCPSAHASDPRFERHWRDAKAELNGYHWKGTRYGELREGRAVLIYVTEPFSASGRVKLDRPADAAPSDVIDVLKLNLIRDFQTGIYDYNTMVSVFSRSKDLFPLKISFTSAEWCGQAYEELTTQHRSIDYLSHSYFQGESASRGLRLPDQWMLEDNLYLALRGLQGPLLAPGAERSTMLLRGAFYRRLNHQPLGWSKARLRRLAAPETISVPAGKFSTSRYIVEIEGGTIGRFFVEEDYPHRLIRWSFSHGPGPDSALIESAELTGSTRLPYWKLHAEGDEKYLKEIGF